MSHRVTTKTEIKDKKLAAEALKLAKMSYTEEGGDRLRITSGDLTHAVIDCRTGEISGDSDYRNHRADSFGMLKQYYGEALARQNAATTGSTIESRRVEQNGTVVLTCVLV